MAAAALAAVTEDEQTAGVDFRRNVACAGEQPRSALEG